MFKRTKVKEGREVKKLILVPRLRKSVDNFDEEHYSEINKADHSLNKITNNIKARVLKLKEPTGSLKCLIIDSLF